MTRDQALERGLLHLRKAESLQSQILHMEREALVQANRGSARVRRSPPEFYAGKTLEYNFFYRSLVSDRNSHQAQASLYLMAALALERS